MRFIKVLAHPKKANSVIVYLNSRCSKDLWKTYVHMLNTNEDIFTTI